jgi:ADP-ribosyl-[dinitrogen reductase] hydrolase
MDLTQRLSGAVWGQLVGDALGVPYEFTDPHDAADVTFRGHGTWNKPPGTWSDDGSLMLAALESELERGFDPADMAERFLRWDAEGAYTPDGEGRFDIGGTTARALDRLRHGVTTTDAGPAEEQANGNGSLMRILPVALVERDLPDAELAAHAHLSSRVTHGHPLAQVSCALYVLACRALLRGVARDEAIGTAALALRAVYAEDTTLAEHRTALAAVEAYTGRAGRTFVVDSLWSAWDAFAGADSYRDAVVRAVCYGSDTDTTASICGGLAGIYWGLDAIPVEWRSAMRGSTIVDPLIERLVATAG